jgi:hypothetical protein
VAWLAASCQAPAETDRVAACAKAPDEACLAALARDGDAPTRARALDALVAMKSKAALPMLLAALLNELQTGGDGAALAAKIQATDPGAIRRAYEDEVAAEVAARKAGSAFAAEQRLANARALARLAGGSTLEVEAQKIADMKKEKRRAELVEKLLDALENGQLSRSSAIAEKLVAELGVEGVARLLPDLQRLAALEDRFYATAQAQEKAKAALDAAKAGGTKAARDAAAAAYNTEKSNMVLIRRALEKERKKLPLVTEKVREATRGP